MGWGAIHSNYEVIALIIRKILLHVFFYKSIKCNRSFTVFILIFPCRKQIMQLSKQLKTVYDFQDLKETVIKMMNESDLLLENLQEEIDFYSSAHNASIMGKRENALQLSVSGQMFIKPIVHSFSKSPRAHCQSTQALQNMKIHSLNVLFVHEYFNFLNIAEPR